MPPPLLLLLLLREEVRHWRSQCIEVRDTEQRAATDGIHRLAGPHWDQMHCHKTTDLADYPCV